MTSRKYAAFGSVIDRAESPIERLFLVALLFMGDYTFEPLPPERFPEVAADATGVVLSVQVAVDEHRIDATLTRPGSAQRFAIELDGHAYHGATPAQFERDSARQRSLTAKGWTFLRFTGREIMRDPRKCAAEAMRAAATLVPPAEGRRDVEPSRYRAGLRPMSAALVAAFAEAGNDWEAQMRVAEAAASRARARFSLTKGAVDQIGADRVEVQANEAHPVAGHEIGGLHEGK